MRTRRTAAAATTTFLACAALTLSGGAFSQRETIGTTSSPLSVQRASVWASPQIAVCWENPGTFARERAWVRAAVARTWETASAVRFTGWGTCARDARGIRIRIADAWPHTEGLGNRLDGRADGMILNFTFNTFSRDCRSRLQFCIDAIAVHEFGHALGFAHEHNRSDRFDCTQAHQGTEPDLFVTPYDRLSIMNYCNPAWNGDGRLSDLDRLGASVLYGKGPTPVFGAGMAMTPYTFEGGQQLETLFVTPSGAVNVLWKVNNSLWKGPAALTGPNVVDPRAWLTTVNYPLGRQLETFFAGNDGAIQVMWKSNNGAWAGPVRLTAPGTVRPGAYVSAVYYPPNQQLEVFYVGVDGAPYVLWKAQNGRWNTPSRLGPAGLAPSGGGVTAAFYPANNQLEVLLGAEDGSVRVLWKANNGRWNGPVALTSSGAITPGGALSVVYYPLNQQFETFFVDPSGRVNVLWKANNGAWSRPVAISPANVGVPGRPIVAVYHPPNQQLEVVTVGPTGAVNLVYKAQNRAWSAPVVLAGPGSAPPGSNVTVAYQELGQQLEVVFTDSGGALNLVYKAQNGAWSRPFRY
ncbi:M12 family metallopeptidase [Deinococcus yavapaiensis]|uniref:Astacin (Peptidase family M12A) n=1 Tax=Deinococcus yavapaiensis KR-236 TaxID=694435 RepID=A0A318S641_9DEIO|nr:M12 family metallopeptidase [Deinococcus yavapaiensis]PYE53092.1 astacin (peptidase family M12A) [Deinococcus yavapaiensis KR-236]